MLLQVDYACSLVCVLLSSCSNFQLLICREAIDDLIRHLEVAYSVLARHFPPPYELPVLIESPSAFRIFGCLELRVSKHLSVLGPPIDPAELDHSLHIDSVMAEGDALTIGEFVPERFSYVHLCFIVEILAVNRPVPPHQSVGAIDLSLHCISFPACSWHLFLLPAAYLYLALYNSVAFCDHIELCILCRPVDS